MISEKWLAELEYKSQEYYVIGDSPDFSEEILELIAEHRQLGLDLELSQNDYGCLRLKQDSIEAENKLMREAIEFVLRRDSDKHLSYLLDTDFNVLRKAVGQ